MDNENCPVLSAAVAYYDGTTRSITAPAVAERIGRDEATVASRLQQLADCELLAPADDGYRPTVTGREFLALDADCGPFIVDTGE